LCPELAVNGLVALGNQNVEADIPLLHSVAPTVDLSLRPHMQRTTTARCGDANGASTLNESNGTLPK
jgi:hypothetical protein